MRVHEPYRRTPFVVALLAVAALVGATTGTPPRTASAADASSLRLETLVPSRSLAFLSFEEIGSWSARWKKTGLGRLVDDPEMQQFAAPVREQIDKLLKGGGGPKDEQIVPPMVRKVFEQVQGLSGQAAVALVELPDGKPPVVAANLDFGDHLRDFTTFLGRMNEDGGEKAPIAAEEKDGRTWWTVGEPGEPQFVGTTVGTSVVGSTDKAWVDAAIASGGAAVDGALATSDAFARARKGAGDEAALFAFGNAPALVDRFGGEMPPDARRIADALGLDTVKGVSYSFGFRGDVFRESLTIDAPGADHGIVPLFRTSPMSKSALRLVPSTAFFYAEGASPLSTLLPKVREMIAKLDPETAQDVEQWLAQARDATGGVDLEKDLLGGLADEMMYYLAMPETGGLYPEFALALKVKDPAKFEATAENAINGLLQTVGREERISARQRTVLWGGKRLHVIDLSSTRKRGMVPFTPTWTMLGDQWVVTLVPHAMKELILRSEAGGKGLAGEEDFSSILRQSPEGATSLGYVDSQALLTLLYDTAVPALQTALKENLLAESPVKLDFAMLPATRTVRPYLRSIGLHSRYDGQSMTVAMDSPVGYLLPSIAIAGAVGFATTQRRHSRFEAEREVIEVGRSDEASVMVADLQVRMIVEAVRGYQAANRSLPSSLGQLLQETDPGTKEAWLDKIPMDPWGGAYEYVVSDRARGQFVVRSAGPDRIPGTADDISHPTDSER